MLQRTLITLALLSLVIGIPAAMAQHGHGHSNHAGSVKHMEHSEHAVHGMGVGMHLPTDEVLTDWGCDKALINSLHKLETRFDEQAVDLHAALEQAEYGLQKAHEDKGITKSAMHTAIDDFFEAKADLMKLHATAADAARETMGMEIYGKIHEAHQ